MAVLGDRDLRDSLRASDIRVASDLTTRQRTCWSSIVGKARSPTSTVGSCTSGKDSPLSHVTEGQYSSGPWLNGEDWPRVQTTGYSRSRDVGHHSSQQSRRNFGPQRTEQSERFNAAYAWDERSGPAGRRPFNKLSAPGQDQHTRYRNSRRQVVSQAALQDAKQLILSAFDENKDGRIDIAELAQILPMEENFLLLFRRDHPLESSVEFMKVWREYDTDHSGFIEADELKMFLHDLLKQCKKDAEVTEEQLITYADTMLQLFDRNKDGKLQLSEMAKLMPVKENFLLRPIFKGAKQLTKEDITRVFSLYDRDNNKWIENEELHGFLKDLMELVQEDYDAEDIEECKAILMKECDLNHDGRIDKDELSMVLISFTRVSRTDECPLQPPTASTKSGK